jgi:hypothetical protein
MMSLSSIFVTGKFLYVGDVRTSQEAWFVTGTALRFYT